MSTEYLNFKVDIDQDEICETVIDGVRRFGVHEHRQKIIDMLKQEAQKAYAPGDDDDFADGVKHAYMLIEKMDEE